MKAESTPDTMDDADPQKATLKLPEQNSLDLLSPEDPLSQPRRSSTSLQSRRHSTASNLSRGSENSDYAHKFGSFSMAPGAPTEEGADKAQISSNDTGIKRALPKLPLGVSVVCLMVNVILPGIGTILSAFFALCFKSSRDNAKDFGLSQFMCMNVFVGVSQILTVTCLMVGWFWGIAWGVYLIDESLKLMKEKERIHAEEMRKKALNVLLGGGEKAVNSSSGNALKNLFSRTAN